MTAFILEVKVKVCRGLIWSSGGLEVLPMGILEESGAVLGCADGGVALCCRGVESFLEGASHAGSFYLRK